LHHEIDLLVGVKHGEAIVQSLKEAAVTFLKRSKPLLLAASTEAATTSETAASESTGKRKRGDESADVELKENPEDERNRRRVRTLFLFCFQCNDTGLQLERAKRALESLRAEQERWHALEREQFSASEASKADSFASSSKQHTTTVLEQTQQAIAGAKLNTAEARRAFESISMNVSTLCRILLIDDLTFHCSWMPWCRLRAMWPSVLRRLAGRSEQWQSVCVHMDSLRTKQ
jgi:hypothetical protein